MFTHHRYALALTDLTRRHRLGPAAVGAICALALLSTACGGDSSDASSPETAVVAETSAPDTLAPTTAATVKATTTVAPTTTAAPRVVVAKGTWTELPGTVVGAANADGSTPITGSLALTGDLAATAPFVTTVAAQRDAEGDLPYTGEWVVEGTLVGVGDGTFSVQESGVFANEGSQASSGTVVGLTGVFEGATGTVTYTGASAAQADYEITFEWPA